MLQIDWLSNEQLKNRLETDESNRKLPYDDATGRTLRIITNTGGKVTIGIGRNLSDVGLSTEEVRYLLTNDIERVCNDLDAKLPWWRKHPEHVQYVLINMCFNLGINGLCKFQTTLNFIKSGQYEEAASNLKHTLWHTQVGSRAIRLEDALEGDGSW